MKLIYATIYVPPDKTTGERKGWKWTFVVMAENETAATAVLTEEEPGLMRDAKKVTFEPVEERAWRLGMARWEKS